MGRPDLASRALKTTHWVVFARRSYRRARAVQIRSMQPLQNVRKIKNRIPHTRDALIGPAGFEPTDGGVKVLCLTAWRRPIMKKDRAACITVRSLVGCLERFELSASRATIWRANQLRHRHHMRPKGLEPPAHCLEGSCSIQLSYGRRFLPTKAFARDIIATPGAFVKRFFNFF